MVVGAVVVVVGAVVVVVGTVVVVGAAVVVAGTADVVDDEVGSFDVEEVPDSVPASAEPELQDAVRRATNKTTEIHLTPPQ